jgi:uncharacterized Ntn-hydrolase superfamily protein
MTFSIVACDLDTPSGPEWGVAVSSYFLAVGTIVPWAREGVGAIATQAMANVSYGPEGLAQMSDGGGADQVLRSLTGADPDRAHRQVGAVDASGNSAAFTGEECLPWAGSRTGAGYSCQGNLLTGGDVVDAMAEAFERESGELGERLVLALEAADSVGGDARGKQSSALVVVREGAGYLGGGDRAVDLRVDDHPEPVAELRRLFDLHGFYFPRPEHLDFVAIDDAVAGELRDLLRDSGYDPGTGQGYDEDLHKVLFNYVGTENLEQRWSEGPEIERRVLDHLKNRLRPGS